MSKTKTKKKKRKKHLPSEKECGILPFSYQNRSPSKGNWEALVFFGGESKEIEHNCRVGERERTRTKKRGKQKVRERRKKRLEHIGVGRKGKERKKWVIKRKKKGEREREREKKKKKVLKDKRVLNSFSLLSFFLFCLKIPEKAM